MSDKIAKKDIVKENEIGQQVVIVPAGQPIPEDLDAAVAATVPQRDASDEDIARARGGDVEDKARRSSRQKSR